MDKKAHKLFKARKISYNKRKDQGRKKKWKVELEI